MQKITIKYEPKTGKKPEKYVFTGKYALESAFHLISKKYLGGRTR